MLTDEDKVLGSYRRAVSKLIPKATRIAWTLKKDDIQKDEPSMTKRKFLYNLSRASYEKNWGKDYQKPTFFERFLAFLVRTPSEVRPAESSASCARRRRRPNTNSKPASMPRWIATSSCLRQTRTGTPDIPNDNFDTGSATPPGVYFMNDDVHAELVEELAKQISRE